MMGCRYWKCLVQSRGAAVNIERQVYGETGKRRALEIRLNLPLPILCL